VEREKLSVQNLLKKLLEKYKTVNYVQKKVKVILTNVNVNDRMTRNLSSKTDEGKSRKFADDTQMTQYQPGGRNK
jgi:hypothetical protein